jgi:hypothetical protein
MRLVRSLAVLAWPLLALACARGSDLGGGNASTTSSAVAESHASSILKGTWRIEGFVAEPGAAASADRLNARMDAQVASMRIAYTGTRVKVWSPGSVMLSNAYEVKEDAPRRCVIESRGERSEIVVVDDDHVIVDRRSAGVGAKMRLRRTDDSPPMGGPE